MAICDYCGTTYRGGAVKDGPYRYCSGHCCDRGKVLLCHLDNIPKTKLNSIIASRIVDHARAAVAIPVSMCTTHIAYGLLTSIQNGK